MTDVSWASGQQGNSKRSSPWGGAMLARRFQLVRYSPSTGPTIVSVLAIAVIARFRRASTGGAGERDPPDRR
ncbi:MAG TPA: hypothetical protein VL100_13125 [Croceibacterium sp.]|nr:hypothetical protein [Croceibacterium sp.]